MTASLRLNSLKAIAILVCLVASILLLTPVFAKEATQSTTRKEKVQQKIDTKKEKVENRVAAMREKMATKEAALKAKLETFKDKRKAEVAERVNTNLNKINQKQTEQMQKHLDKMSALLDKLDSRVNKSNSDVNRGTISQGEIKDPAASKVAIATAKANIATTSAAVSAQAEKDYTLQVTTESRVKGEAQTKRDQLHKDLQAVRKMVIDAKQYVANAVRVAKSGKVEEGTPSGQQ